MVELPAEYDSLNNIRLLNVNLKKIKHFTIADKLFGIKAAIYNYHQIANIQKMINPDAIVLGSDLGGINVRLLLAQINHNKTKVIVNYLCDVPPAANNFQFGFLNNILSKINLNIFKFARAMIFRGEIVGSFDTKSHIFVASSEIVSKLVSMGIKRNRLSLYNNFKNTFSNNVTKNSLLGISNNLFVVAFYTECIQDVYGIEYAEKIYSDLSSLFINLSLNGIYVIVKPHPLEPKTMLNIINKKFNESNMLVVEKIDACSLIRIADVNVAHYSKVLITACMMKKCVLSINLKSDSTRTFLQNDEKSRLEVNSLDELKRDLFKLKMCMGAREDNANVVNNVAQRFREGSSDELFEMITS